MAGIAAQARKELGQGQHPGSWRVSGQLRRSQLQSTSGQGPAATGSGAGGWDTIAEEQQGGGGGVWGRLRQLFLRAGAAEGPEASEGCQQASPTSDPERAGQEGLRATDIEMGAGVSRLHRSLVHCKQHVWLSKWAGPWSGLHDAHPAAARPAHLPLQAVFEGVLWCPMKYISQFAACCRPSSSLALHHCTHLSSQDSALACQSASADELLVQTQTTPKLAPLHKAFDARLCGALLELCSRVRYHNMMTVQAAWLSPAADPCTTSASLWEIG